MNWSTFILIVIIGYTVYYLLNVCFDLFIAAGITATDEDPEDLLSVWTSKPEIILPQQEEQSGNLKSPDLPAAATANGISSGKVTSSGGVGIKALFALAMENLIEHTREIPYA